MLKMPIWLKSIIIVNLALNSHINAIVGLKNAQCFFWLIWRLQHPPSQTQPIITLISILYILIEKLINTHACDHVKPPRVLPQCNRAAQYPWCRNNCTANGKYLVNMYCIGCKYYYHPSSSRLIWHGSLVIVSGLRQHRNMPWKWEL